MAQNTPAFSPLEEQAMLIASEIFNLINQYTNDSNIAKFFLSDEIAKACYGLAGGFSSVMYTPALKPSELQDTPILSFFYALMTYGFNIYLKERSLLTNAAPYYLPTDVAYIKKIQKKTLTLTSRGDLVSTLLADKIITILFENIHNQIDLTEFTIKGHRFSKRKFWDYTKLSLYWGYNFGRGLLDEEKLTSRKRKVGK